MNKSGWAVKINRAKNRCPALQNCQYILPSVFIWLARYEENLFFSYHAEVSENRDMWIGVVAHGKRPIDMCERP